VDSENPSHAEGEDVEQMFEPGNKFLVFMFAFSLTLILSLLLTLEFLHSLHLLHITCIIHTCRFSSFNQ